MVSATPGRWRPFRGRRAAACAASVMVAVPALMSGCGGGSGGGAQLEIFAAASLAGAFERLADDFEAAHPDVDVRLTLGGSSSLARQILDGAEADVFVSADEATMAGVVDSHKAGGSVLFARNALALVVEPGNPRDIADLADLADPGLVLALCALQVPCGRLAVTLLARAGVEVRADSLEPDVRGVVSKVALGEADVGIVYTSDVLAAGRGVEGIEIEASLSDPDLQAGYVAAVLEGSRARGWARAWVGELRSGHGQRVLQGFGLLAP